MAGGSTDDAPRPGAGRRSERIDAGPDGPPDPIPCPPCQGTGTLISNLGGTPTTVTCPWCEGGGVFLPGHDAQAARREQGEEKAEAGSEPG